MNFIYSFSKLNNTHINEIKTFSCGETSEHTTLNDFIKQKAISQQEDLIGTTLIAFHKNKIVGYITLLSDLIEVENFSKSNVKKFTLFKKHYGYKKYPAIKIGRLATTKEYQGKGVGTYLLELTIGIAFSINDNVGARFITVDSKKVSREWYLTKKNFKVLNKKESEYHLFYDLKGWKK